MRNLSLRKRWLLSFLAVIVMILSIISAINGISIRVINKELLRVNTNEFNYLHQTIDMQMREFINTAAEISINSKNLSLMEEEDSGVFTNSGTSSFLGLLRSIKITNELISSVYIYYPNAQYIVGNLGCYPVNSYWQLLNINGGFEMTDSDLWMKDVLNKEAIGFFIDESTGRLMYRTTFPQSGKSVRGIFILEINESGLYNMLKAVTDGRDAVFALLDSDGQVLNGAGSEKDLQLLRETMLAQQDQYAGSTGIVSVQTKGQTLLSVASSYSNIRYVLLADNSQMLRASLRVTYFSFAGIGVCLLLGVLMAYYSSRKNSRSVEKLAASLAPKDEPACNVGNEFDFLEQRVSLLLRQNAESIQQNEELNWRLKSSFLSQILNTSQEEPNVITSIAVFNKLSFDFMQYRLLIFVPVSAKGLSAQHWDIVNKNIQLRAAGMETESNMVVVPCVYKDSIVILLNYNAEDFDEEKIKEIMLQFKQLAFYNNGIQCEAVCSEEFETLSLLVAIYAQTFRQLPLEKKEGTPSGEAGNNGRSLFLRWEKSVRGKEYIQARSLCGGVLTDYVKAAPSAYCGRSRQYAMANIILEHLRENAGRCGAVSAAEAEESLFAAFSDLPRLQKAMENLLLEMERENRSHLETQQGHVAQEIKRVIDENFNQPYLGLYFISDAVGVSTSYVSKAFKQRYGIGVNDYINKTRIQCAKKLIEKGGLSVRDIAASVGFSSDINFIRVFKKLEHITPGQFRKEKD